MVKDVVLPAGAPSKIGRETGSRSAELLSSVSPTITGSPFARPSLSKRKCVKEKNLERIKIGKFDQFFNIAL
jgi:hypothetical protein